MKLSSVLVFAIYLATLSVRASGQTSTDKAVARARAAEERYFETRRQGVVRINTLTPEGNGETGSGIILAVSPNRILVLTALHVLKDATSINVMFYLTKPIQYQATLLKRRSDSLDLAVLQILSPTGQSFPTGFPEYRFVDNNDLHASSQLYTINGDGVLVINSLTRLNHDGDAQRFEYTNISVGKGFSGGPVFNTYGNVIGMHTAVDGEGNFSVAVKIDSALQTLDALGYSVPKAGPPSSDEYLSTVLGYSRDQEDSRRAFTPPQTKGPLNPILENRPAPAVATVAPCDSGCSASFNALKLVRQYHSTQATNQTIETVESVFELPSDWPGPHFLHKLSMVDRRTNTPLGATGGLLQGIAYLASTDRAGDRDCALLGSGGTCRDNTGLFVYKLLGLPGGQPSTIEIHPRRLHGQP